MRSGTNIRIEKWSFRSLHQGYQPAKSLDEALKNVPDGGTITGTSSNGNPLCQAKVNEGELKWIYVNQSYLEALRKYVVDHIYETADFSEIGEITSSSGANINGTEWDKPVFIVDEENDGDSRKVILSIDFHLNSDQPATVTCDGVDLCYDNTFYSFPVQVEADPDEELEMAP